MIRRDSPSRHLNILQGRQYKVLPSIILYLPRYLCRIYCVAFKVDNRYQVLFRYALAILKSIEGKIMRQNDYMSIFNTFRTEIEALSDVRSLTQVTFHPPKERKCRLGVFKPLDLMT